VVAKYRAGLLKAPELLARLPELRGKDLMCWCALGEACHADVLLELAKYRSAARLKKPRQDRAGRG
jgi:Domain of unknown function (DUF4326)